MKLVKDIFHKIKANGFLRYAIVGSSSYIINLGSLILIVQGLGIDPVKGSSINQIFVLLYVFLLNKYWSFNSKGKSIHQMIRFFTLVAWNYSFSIAWMWVWIKKIGATYYVGHWDIAYILVNITSIFVMISWNLFLYKYFVYNK